MCLPFLWLYMDSVYLCVWLICFTCPFSLYVHRNGRISISKRNERMVAGIRYLSVYNSSGKLTLWPGQSWYFDLLLFHSTAGKLGKWDVWRHKHTHTRSSSCRISPSHYWVRGGEAERNENRFSDIQYCLLQAQTQYTTTPVLAKINIFCTYFYSHTTINPPRDTSRTSNCMWHVNHSCAVSCEWLHPFSKQVGLEF